MAGESELFEEWFRIAGNRDGRVEGAGAVQFFQRSGLPKDVLKEIWGLTAGNASFMTKPQFFAAIQLVALGQNNGGTFTPQQARAVMVGTAPPLPTPKLQGLTAETWHPGAQPAQPQFPPGQPPVSHVPQGGQSWPTLSQADFARFEQTFIQLDQDGDGIVQGSECFNTFVSTGVDRSVLKMIWATVAGNEGFLRKDNFIKCLYLIENAKRGIPPPSTLPEGIPPVAQPSGLGAQPHHPQALPHQVNPFPPLPPAAVYQAPNAQPYEPRGLELNDASVSMLNPVYRGRLDSEREAALTVDQDLYNQEQRLATSQQKKEFYEKALQDMVLFKRRVGTKLLEIEERARQETLEANDAEKAYEQAREDAERAAEESGAMFKNIRAMQESRMEWETKLQTVQREAAELEGANPEEVTAIEADIEKLKEEVASVEAVKSSLSAQLEGYKQQQEKLVQRKEDLQLVCAAAEAEIHSAASDIDKIKSEIEDAKGSDDIDKIQKLIREASRVYSNLHAHACKAGIEIPKETRLMLYGQDLLWADDMIASGTEIEEWQEDGFIVVDAFPDVKDELDKVLFDAVMASAKSTGVSQTKTEQAPLEFAMTFDDAPGGFTPFQQSDQPPTAPPAAAPNQASPPFADPFSNPQPTPPAFEMTFDSDPFASPANPPQQQQQQQPPPLDPFSAFPPPAPQTDPSTTTPAVQPAPAATNAGFAVSFEESGGGGGGFGNFGSTMPDSTDPFSAAAPAAPADPGPNQAAPLDLFADFVGGGNAGGTTEQQAKPSDNPFGESAFG
ncbi:hypothetical protein BSKO_08517 [Bryopsis sp. KO-2023]|nr:hypothetical protein BSKO_08517 [Bryopsis sp. KO-2023]